MFWFRWPNFPVDCGWWIGPPPRAWDRIGIEAGDQDSEATTPLAQQLNDFHHSSKCIALLQIGSRGLLSSLGLMQIGLQLELVEVLGAPSSVLQRGSLVEYYLGVPWDSPELLFPARILTVARKKSILMGIWISHHYNWLWIGIRQNKRLLIGPPPL